tara:strand:- start:1165 stop:2931 length:1767 start_codon:yes stop_codon:yes gene_type:complete
MHRNLGIFTTRKIPLEKLFSQFQGKANGFTKGRDRSFHFGTQEHHLVGMISHLGPQLGVADGIALADLIQKKKKVTLVFTGDGGTSQGDFHEAVNVASVWNLPVIFVIENNGYGLSTPSNQQFNFDSFLVKGPAYGIEAVSVDGNNILEVMNELEKVCDSIRERPRPVIFEAKTFRMRGHEEASGTKYVPKELMDYWAKKDPIANYESFLIESGIDSEILETLKEDTKKEINSAVKKAFSEAPLTVNPEQELADIYAPFTQKHTDLEPTTREIRYVDAISEGLRQSLEHHEELVFLGQDIAEYGGVFKISEGFLEQFGPLRIRNTPLCESAIVGITLGLSIAGMKAVMEMQFADFVTCGFNQIVNNLAKSYYRWAQNADVVIRMPTGAGVNAGPFHSQSNEAWFFHTPGLKIVYPSTPAAAKGLLCAAIEDPNPYLFFEHKYLYRSLTGPVVEDYHTMEIGKAHVALKGNRLTIVTYGMGVHWALEASKTIDELEIIDLCTLMPWDKETVSASVKKTNKSLVLHEDCITGGIGAEIAAWIGTHCFEDLDAPVLRVGSLDTPVPFSDALEQNFLPQQRLLEQLDYLLKY